MLLERNRKYRATPEFLEQQRLRYASDPEYRERKIQQSAKRRNLPGAGEKAALVSRQWRKDNPERFAETLRSYDERNRDTVRPMRTEAIRRRKALQDNAVPCWFDKEKVDAFYLEAARLTKETGISHEVDHIIPIGGKNVVGLHWHGNLQILTRSENRRKCNRVSE